MTVSYPTALERFFCFADCSVQCRFLSSVRCACMQCGCCSGRGRIWFPNVLWWIDYHINTILYKISHAINLHTPHLHIPGGVLWIVPAPKISMGPVSWNIKIVFNWDVVTDSEPVCKLDIIEVENDQFLEAWSLRYTFASTDSQAIVLLTWN